MGSVPGRRRAGAGGRFGLVNDQWFCSQVRQFQRALKLGQPVLWAQYYLHFALFSIGLDLTYGPQAALYSELFPASVRFSGVSISYAIGAILGGAFAPTIAQALVQATGGTTAVAVYLLVVVATSVTAVSLIRDRAGIDLSFRNQAEQEVGALITDKRTVESVKTVQEV